MQAYCSSHEECIVKTERILLDPYPRRSYEQRHCHAEQSRDLDIPGMVVWSDWREAVPVWSLGVSTLMDHRLGSMLLFKRAGLAGIFVFQKTTRIAIRSLRFNGGLQSTLPPGRDAETGCGVVLTHVRSNVASI